MARSEPIAIPREYDADQRQAIGEEIVEAIIRRTNNGIDKYGKAFDAYSKSYKSSLEFRVAGKTNTPNLKLSGDMHTSLRVLSHRSGQIVIGWPDGYEADKAKWNVEKGRDMLGISTKDLNKILSRYPINRPEPSSSFIGSIAAEFVKSISTRNTSE